jgi:hypothetical protein
MVTQDKTGEIRRIRKNMEAVVGVGRIARAAIHDKDRGHTFSSKVPICNRTKASRHRIIRHSNVAWARAPTENEEEEEGRDDDDLWRRRKLNKLPSNALLF